jgi:hypothetical protein
MAGPPGLAKGQPKGMLNDPAIHAHLSQCSSVDTRVKPAHDDRGRMPYIQKLL